VAEDLQHLFAGYAFIPTKKIVHTTARFKILEERANRKPCALENPRAADTSGDAFHGGTL
jgi:hypothetical protein